jgi:outer membrane protein assembly factor BamB
MLDSTLYRSVLVTLLAAASVRIAPAATDWPRFRGPNGQGVSEITGLPVHFGPAQALAWKIEVPAGSSSPIIAGDRIFLTAHEGDERLVLCLEAATGKVIWRRAVPKLRSETANPINGPATPTPVSDGANVYVFFPEIGLLSFGSDGEQRWRTPLGPFQSVQGLAASPILVDGKVVLLIDQTGDSYIAAFDARDGSLAWKTERPSTFLGGYSTPTVYEPADGPAQLLVAGALEFTSYGAASGKRLWWANTVTNAPVSVPVVGDGVVYLNEPAGENPPAFDGMLGMDKNKDGKIALTEVGGVLTRLFSRIDQLWGDSDGVVDDAEWRKAFQSLEGSGGLVAVRLGGTGDVTDTHIQWRYVKSLPYLASALLYDKVLYVVREGGILTSLNPATGEVLKQGRIPDAMDDYYASPIAADGKIYVVSKGGKVSVLKAAGEWEVLATNDLAEECIATPAIAQGRLFVRTVKALYSFGSS